MKLLLCPTCSDVFKLDEDELRQCKCGKCSGRYVDNINAEVWGDGVVIGFANGSLARAIMKQRAFGDLIETMGGCYGREVKGREFDAFIIPDSAASVVRK